MVIWFPSLVREKQLLGANENSERFASGRALAREAVAQATSRLVFVRVVRMFLSPAPATGE
jgi:hypothetical protein